MRQNLAGSAQPPFFPFCRAPVPHQAADHQLDRRSRNFLDRAPLHPGVVTHDQMQSRHAVHAAPENLRKQVRVLIVVAEQPGCERLDDRRAHECVGILIGIAALDLSQGSQRRAERVAS